MEDLIPPGAASGTVPSDLDQAVGLERLEILGKIQGIDIFDMKPLDASRLGKLNSYQIYRFNYESAADKLNFLGTMDNPIMVKSAGEENYAGCTGYPADSHNVIWLTVSRSRPIERCPECGNVLKMEYIGPPDDPHAHDHHGYEEPKTFADYIRPEYRYR
ncbi:Cytochrome c oxidase subunit 4, mitochondrial [Golovinomyces cichoracearum]|uniref:Cytochrome c oxidase subunit 4, mitochondrial n=1 Tax=Golovinomyces cichoracearum TaxID=62708 RepID=A0A420J975_9PEZI|nr:Cytochrome c oxidase subunit 4, mitochondrial [Golovinomyces cichoracearum]